MLHTTFTKVKEANACIKRYKKFAKFKGGIKKWGKDVPFPLVEVLEVCGLQDAIWCFRCTIEPSKYTLVEFACQCAEHVLHYYEDKYPNDKRPRQAIESARVCLTNKSKTAAWGVARDAARAARDAARAAAGAARDAAWAAAWVAWAAAGAARDAARDATGAARAAAWAARDAAWVARDGETEWQTQLLKRLLEANQ